MKKPLMKWWSVWSGLTVALVLVGVVVVHGQTATPSKGAAPSPQSSTQKPPSMMVEESQASAMMAQRQQMMASMRALDQKLDALVSKMNAARGTDKVDAIAAVVKEMVTQRTQMRDQMMTMDDRMMGHMIQHMTSMQGGMMSMMNGGQKSAVPSMDNCPMMKTLTQEGTAGDHSEHHPPNK
jgi:hypothetical protein